MEKDPKVYIRHILEAIANIEADTVGYEFDTFRKDRRARQVVERNLEIAVRSQSAPSGGIKGVGRQHPVACDRWHRERAPTRISPHLSNCTLGYV